MYLSIGQTFILLSLSESDIIQYLMSLSGCTKLLAAVDSRRMRATGRRERAASSPQTLRPGAAAGRTGPCVPPHPNFPAGGTAIVHEWRAGLVPPIYTV